MTRFHESRCGLVTEVGESIGLDRFGTGKKAFGGSRVPGR